jgi:hypothetical protein
VEVLFANRKEFEKFKLENLEQRTQAIHVALLQSLDPGQPAIPICVFSHTSGAVCTEWQEVLNGLVEWLQSKGMSGPVHGLPPMIAADGEQHNMPPARDFAEWVDEQFKTALNFIASAPIFDLGYRTTFNPAFGTP